MLYVTFNHHIHVYTKEYLNYQFQNILYIYSILQIFCQMHLLIKSVILFNPYNLMCQKRVEI
jgi:hypothetical protein